MVKYVGRNTINGQLMRNVTLPCITLSHLHKCIMTFRLAKPNQPF